MRGKYQKKRDFKEGKADLGSNNKASVFSPGLMKYDGQGKFTFYKVKPKVIFKFIWDVLIHGKPGTRKDKRIR